jgi:hypothetical protein
MKSLLLIFLSINSSISQDVTKKTFPGEKEAMVYLFQQRLQIQRSLNNSIDSLTGKPEEKTCKENVNVEGKIKKESWGSYTSFKVLMNDKMEMNDCLPAHNTKRVLIEYYLCGKEVTEIKTIKKIDETLPDVPTKKCPL